tara:strand:- start:9029 stop:9499 length:471 start_codon:yes stop_codon:yes gene_type:complete
MKSTTVVLTPSEMVLAASAGVMRNVKNINAKLKDAYKADPNQGWQMHIEGALGEMALAKFLGLYWPGVGKMRGTDVGEVDVRTRSRADYELILHEKDPDDRVFWLLCGNNGRYDVKGWILCADGKRQEYWSDPSGKNRPAFFVPQSKLNPPDKGEL